MFLRLADRSVRPTEDDSGMEQSSGDTRGNGDEIALSTENFHLSGAGEFGKINGPSGPDAADGGFVGGDRRKLREEFARVDEEFLEIHRKSRSLHFASLSLRDSEASVGMTIFIAGMTIIESMIFDRARVFLCFCKIIQRMGVGDGEFGNGCAAEGFQMRATIERVAHVVGDGTHVGS